MPKVLFVCTGNVCRSPMAEAMFRELTKDLEDMQVHSAGISAPAGESPSPHAIKVLRKRGLDISTLRSKQLTPRLVEEATHIFSMTLGHKTTIEKRYPKATEKSFLLREFESGTPLQSMEEGLLDIPDPIGMNLAAYETTFELIEDALPSVLKFVQETSGPIP